MVSTRWTQKMEKKKKKKCHHSVFPLPLKLDWHCSKLIDSPPCSLALLHISTITPQWSPMITTAFAEVVVELIRKDAPPVLSRVMEVVLACCFRCFWFWVWIYPTRKLKKTEGGKVQMFTSLGHMLVICFFFSFPA